jgi:hypothetical protein
LLLNHVVKAQQPFLEAFLMTYIRLVGYNLRYDYVGDQVHARCEGEPGWPPCPWRLRFPLAWLHAACQGRQANLDGVLAQYAAHKEEAHRAHTRLD